MTVSASQCQSAAAKAAGSYKPSTFHRITRARYGHPLRFYILCCFAKCAPVAPLKLRLVPPTAARPGGFTKPTICKVPALGSGAQPSALPGRIRALRAAARAPCHGCGLLALVRRYAQGSGRWPTARHNVCDPARPTASPLCGVGPSAPVGAPSTARRLLWHDAEAIPPAVCRARLQVDTCRRMPTAISSNLLLPIHASSMWRILFIR